MKTTNGKPAIREMTENPYPVVFHSESHDYVEPVDTFQKEPTTSFLDETKDADRLSSHSSITEDVKLNTSDKDTSFKSKSDYSDDNHSLPSGSVDNYKTPVTDNFDNDSLPRYQEPTVNKVDDVSVEPAPPGKFVSVINVVATKSEDTTF